jgi:YesN/AraC family two-component response regulator
LKSRFIYYRSIVKSRLNINIPNIIGFVSYQLIFILPIFLFLSIYIKKIHTYIKKETPNVLDNNIIIEEETAEETQNIISENDTEKYKMNKISEDDATEYLEKIIKFVEENESYKDNSFNLTKLSNELNIPSAYISQALNIYKGETFYNFLNKYRIEIAKKMLIDPKYKNKTILAIAYESGFNSKATFNIFFKKIVGMTPSAYRNKN